jgi:hypothetical protein
MSNESEVARIRRQIEEESQAMHDAMTGMSMSAKHDIIIHRYATIGQCRDQLVPLVGDEQASNMMTDAYMRGIEGRVQ